jgi:DNA helicase-2/ATP-dependent DNA helicase PcrA
MDAVTGAARAGSSAPGTEHGTVETMTTTNPAEAPRSEAKIPERLLEGLNPEQRDAVETLLGPLAVIAGPGSGKTRVLTHRLAALVESGLSAPSRILAVTFTNKAAGEMRDRAATILGEETAGRMWITTFHSFCAKFLRFEAEAAGLPRAYSILDSGDVRTILREVHRELGLPDEPGEIRASASLISRIKNGAGGTPNPTALRVLAAYRDRLTRLGSLDFDDLLLRTKELLETNPMVREKWQQRFSYILVDEYQDTNPVQYAIIGMLAAGHRNICVVGDADQAIYGFRAATPAALIGFTEAWADAKIVLLEENYRSTPEILAVCQRIIDGNDSTIRPRLRTANPSGEPVRLVVCGDDREEARYVTAEIRQRGVAGATAVLVRTNAQTRGLEDAMMQTGLPYSVIGALRFYERAEIKDAVSYLKLVRNPVDVLSLIRAAAAPKRGLGPKALEQVVDTAAGGDLVEAIRRGLADGTLTRSKAGWTALLEALDTIATAAETQGPVAAVRAVLDSGVRDHVKATRDERTEERLENLDELENAAAEFASNPNNLVDEETGETHSPGRLTEMFLERIALVSASDDVDEADGAVQILTAHASKGKEFKEVYVVGVEENLFPHGRHGETADEAEERRLLFVACSRAEERLTITCAERRLVHGKPAENPPSRFLADAGDLLRTVRAAGAGGRTGGNWRENHRTGGRSERWGRPTGPTPRPAMRAAGPRMTEPDATPGRRVRHAKFGDGRIAERHGTGSDTTVTIRFDNGDTRQFKLELAPLEAL